MKFKTIAKEMLYEQFQDLPLNLSFDQIKQELGIRPFLTEATICAPVHPTDIKEFMGLFDRKIPAAVSIFLISDLLNDDGLNAELNAYAEKDPYADARSVIVQWVSNNMPQITPTAKFDNTEGLRSPLGSQDFH